VQQQKNSDRIIEVMAKRMQISEDLEVVGIWDVSRTPWDSFWGQTRKLSRTPWDSFWVQTRKLSQTPWDSFGFFTGAGFCPSLSGTVLGFKPENCPRGFGTKSENLGDIAKHGVPEVLGQFWGSNPKTVPEVLGQFCCFYVFCLLSQRFGAKLSQGVRDSFGGLTPKLSQGVRDTPHIPTGFRVRLRG
jgi:hypothetical protein